MKNIIIAGPGRSGKSTLARMISEDLGYYIINSDKLVSVFQNAYPDLNIRLNWDRDKTTENLAPFLGHFLGTFSSEDGKGLLKYSQGACSNNGFILEGAYFEFDKIASVLKDYGIGDLKERFILIGLVQNKKTSDDFFRDFRLYDTDKDWTYNLSDDELKAVSEDAVEFSRTMSAKLKEYEFKIFDTSEKRDEVFGGIIEYIRKEINNG